MGWWQLPVEPARDCSGLAPTEGPPGWTNPWALWIYDLILATTDRGGAVQAGCPRPSSQLVETSADGNFIINIVAAFSVCRFLKGLLFWLLDLASGNRKGLNSLISLINFNWYFSPNNIQHSQNILISELYLPLTDPRFIYGLWMFLFLICNYIFFGMYIHSHFEHI